VRRAQHRRRKRKTRRLQLTGQDMVKSFDRSLEEVNANCDSLRIALEGKDVATMEQTAYALAAAWFLAEAHAMRILGLRPDCAAFGQYAQRAIAATSAVVTARFGEALAQTLRWLPMEPKPQGIARLRTVLAQLAGRVDVRNTDALGQRRGVPSQARKSIRSGAS
jgi:hypothetical protein